MISLPPESAFVNRKAGTLPPQCGVHTAFVNRKARGITDSYLEAALCSLHLGANTTECYFRLVQLCNWANGKHCKDPDISRRIEEINKTKESRQVREMIQTSNDPIKLTNDSCLKFV